MSFLKDHVVGIALLAIGTGVAATFVYDFFDLKPRTTFFGSSKPATASDTGSLKPATPTNTASVRQRYQYAKAITSAPHRDDQLGALVREAIGARDFDLAREIAKDISSAPHRDDAILAILAAQR